MKKFCLVLCCLLAFAAPVQAAITSVGTLGTVGVTTNDGSTTALTTSAQCDAGNICVCSYAADSDNNTDENSTSVTSVTDSAGGNTWAKLGERNNNGNSSSSQVVVSTWWTKAVNSIASSGTITFNHTATHDFRAITCWEFAVAGGKTLSLAASATPSEGGGVDLPSIAIGSLSSLARLYLRCSGTNGAITITATTNFTKFTEGVANTGDGSTARTSVCEFRINTSTGETSDPTASQNTTNVNVMFALEEVDEAASRRLAPPIMY